MKFAVADPLSACALEQPGCLGDASVVKEPGDGVHDVTATAEVLRLTATG